MDLGLSTLSDLVTYTKYASFLPDKNRRETWEEIVQRNSDFMCARYPHIKDQIKEAYGYVLRKQVLGSMRMAQFAGPAVEKNNSRAYNCAFSTITDIYDISELFFNLLCGTGVGYSVQSRHVSQLPLIKGTEDKTTIFMVEDTIEGWADAALHLLKAYTQRRPEPEFTYEMIRPQNTRLLTSGGFAPGPEPLKKALENTRAILRQAKNRRLKPIEVHDICCHLADAVYAGGIRRAAMIAFFDISDTEMLQCKSGEWWVHNGQRARANNSVVAHRQHTTEEEFRVYFSSLQEAGSGEPGLYWTNDYDVLSNPCVSSRTWVMTDQGPRQVKDLIGKKFNAVVHGQVYSTTSSGFWNTGKKKIYQLTTDRGYFIELTENHQLQRVSGDQREWVEAKDLKEGDEIQISNHRAFTQWAGHGSFEEGYLLGCLVGDGTFTQNDDKNNAAHIDLWSEPDRADRIHSMLNQTVKRSTEAGIEYSEKHDRYRISSIELAGLAVEYGILPTDKTPNERMDMSSSAMHAGFLRGLFDSSGSVQESQSKGVSVRLTQSTVGILHLVQRMLQRFGIASTVYENKCTEGEYPLSNGHGDVSPYHCDTVHDLVITCDNIPVFAQHIGFWCQDKAASLDAVLSQYKTQLNKERFTASVKSIKELGVEDVYDVCVPGPDAFCANGIFAHNCVEIALFSHQFCNLTSVNALSITSKKDFYDRVRAAAFIGTLQAGLTDFIYLRDSWRKQTEEEALLGVSITGIGGGKLTDVDLQKAAQLVVLENQRVAPLIGIRPAARTTCIKPEGSGSAVLGTPSGIHSWKSDFYLRTMRFGKNEPIYKYLLQKVPELMEDSVYNEKDGVFFIPVAANEGGFVEDKESAITLLERVRYFTQNWIKPGHNKGPNTHNISCTVTVREEEWMDVRDWKWANREYYNGLALLPQQNTYQQAPFITISKDEYLEKVRLLKKLDLREVVEYENNTNLIGELACAGGACEIL